MAEETQKPEIPQIEKPPEEAPGDELTFFPKVVLGEFLALLLTVGVVVALAVLIPVGYEEKVNTLITPAGVKAEWYFLWTYQLMKLVPVLVGMGILALIVVLIFILPWLDRKPGRKIGERIWVIAIGLMILAGIGVLTFWALLPGGE
jgi:quinol-cytochrome oxidoreductase complex cytochrome b subunit